MHILPTTPKPLIVMLGSNDLLQDRSPEETAEEQLRLCFRHLGQHRPIASVGKSMYNGENTSREPVPYSIMAHRMGKVCYVAGKAFRRWRRG